MPPFVRLEVLCGHNASPGQSPWIWWQKQFFFGAWAVLQFSMCLRIEKGVCNENQVNPNSRYLGWVTHATKPCFKSRWNLKPSEYVGLVVLAKLKLCWVTNHGMISSMQTASFQDCESWWDSPERHMYIYDMIYYDTVMCIDIRWYKYILFHLPNNTSEFFFGTWWFCFNIV